MWWKKKPVVLVRIPPLDEFIVTEVVLLGTHRGAKVQMVRKFEPPTSVMKGDTLKISVYLDVDLQTILEEVE